MRVKSVAMLLLGMAAVLGCGAALAQAYPTKPVKLIFADLGVEAISSTPARFAAFLKVENEKYAKLIKQAGIEGN